MNDEMSCDAMEYVCVRCAVDSIWYVISIYPITSETLTRALSLSLHSFLSFDFFFHLELVKLTFCHLLWKYVCGIHQMLLKLMRNNNNFPPFSSCTKRANGMCAIFSNYYIESNCEKSQRFDVARPASLLSFDLIFVNKRVGVAAETKQRNTRIEIEMNTINTRDNNMRANYIFFFSSFSLRFFLRSRSNTTKCVCNCFLFFNLNLYL